MSRTGRRLPAVIVLLALGAPGRSASASVIPLTFEELTQKSKHVITGEVTGLRSYRAPFHDLGEVIFTDVTVRIDRVLKGAPAGKEITIQVLGGEIGTHFQLCLESPRYMLGEKVLIFARDYHHALWNTGWSQGKYALDPSGATVRGDAKMPIARDTALSDIESEVHRLTPAPSGANDPRAAPPLDTQPPPPPPGQPQPGKDGQK
jgi:hypothetical protein